MAVKALLHYALEVPDAGAGEKFYSNFGLLTAPSRDATVRLRPAPLQRESVLLYGGPKKRLHHLAFGAPGDEYAATREAVRRAGIREVDPPRGAPEGGFWVRDPDSNLVNIRDEAGGGLAAGVGSRTSRDRLELLLLRPRPLGELRGVLPRPRLHSRAVRVGAARLPRGGRALPLGSAGARGLRPEPRAPDLTCGSRSSPLHRPRSTPQSCSADCRWPARRCS